MHARAAEIADVGMRNMRRKRLMASSKQAPIWISVLGLGWEVMALSRVEDLQFCTEASPLPRRQQRKPGLDLVPAQPGICRMRTQSSLYYSG
jgi:hypothetical protein